MVVLAKDGIIQVGCPIDIGEQFKTPSCKCKLRPTCVEVTVEAIVAHYLQLEDSRHEEGR